MARIIPIDFQNSNHKKAIKKLAKVNHFHVEDVTLYLDGPAEFFVLCNHKPPSPLRGFFSTIKDTDGKEKVVGFIIFDYEPYIIDAQKQTPLTFKTGCYQSEVLFLLIDHRYRRQTFGHQLMQKYMAWFYYTEVLIAVVKFAKGAVLQHWYEQFDFHVDYKPLLDLQQPENIKYMKMMHVPPPTLHYLKMTRYIWNNASNLFTTKEEFFATVNAAFEERSSLKPFLK
jgi:GNAT superfamily N-acetyltransferase